MAKRKSKIKLEKQVQGIKASIAAKSGTKEEHGASALPFQRDHRRRSTILNYDCQDSAKQLRRSRTLRMQLGSRPRAVRAS